MVKRLQENISQVSSDEEESDYSDADSYASDVEAKDTDFKKVKRLDPIMHILKRPTNYIGRLKKAENGQYLFDEDSWIVSQEFFEYSPALFKIIDEILVNAADRVREGTTTKIWVDCNMETGWISVKNNGKALPVYWDEDEKLWSPHLAFGVPFSGTHFDDEGNGKARKAGGINGIGSKATAVFSLHVNLEIFDDSGKAKKGKNVLYTQTFKNNLSKIEQPKFVYSDKDDDSSVDTYVCYSFLPDYARFGLDEGIEEEVYKWIRRRCLDISMTTNMIKPVDVFFNKKLCKVKEFTDYVDLYLPEYDADCVKITKSQDKKVIKETVYADSDKKELRWIKCTEICDDWTICALYDPSKEVDPHVDVSFVNCVNTHEGGTHLRIVSNAINNEILNNVKKKVKKSDEFLLKKSDLNNYVMYFVSCFIDNPEFDQQSKFKLTSTEKEMSSVYKPSKKFLEALITKDLIDSLKKVSEFNSLKTLTKDSKKSKYEVIEGHQRAESKNRQLCTLFLTEGNSASTAVNRGFAIIGTEFFGLFQIRGKPINPRDMTAAALKKKLANPKSAAMKLIKIMGLKIDQEYDSFDKLNYRHIIAFMDEDLDGSHIKCLIYNFFQVLWPSLFKIKDGRGSFIKLMKTPLMRITKTVKKTHEEKIFYTLQSYDRWKKDTKEKGWSEPSYYKGMGSHGDRAKDLFIDIDNKLIDITWATKWEDAYMQDIDEDDVSMDSLLLAFGEEYASNRRDWINEYNPDNEIDVTKKKISISELIHYGLLPFSVSDNVRSIPSLVDGLKPVHRMIFYVMMGKALAKLNLDDGSKKGGKNKQDPIEKKLMKLLSIAGKMIDKLNYHHGDTSIHEAVFTMGQVFAGANNMALFEVDGEFGTRRLNGDDATAARYASAGLSPLAKKIFRIEDLPVLERRIDSGKAVEPFTFVPVIPYCLTKKSSGLGTGWSNAAEPCNPKEVIKNVRNWIAEKDLFEMKPWYHNFTGQVIESQDEDNKYLVKGVYKIKKGEPNCVYIYDLPVGTSVEKYDLDLEAQISRNLTKIPKKKKEDQDDTNRTKKLKANEVTKNIVNRSNRSSGNNIWFKIYFVPDYLKTVDEDTLEKGLSLVKKVNNMNMAFFDKKRKLKKYPSYLEILEEFCKTRKHYYKLRKSDQIKKLEFEILKLENLIQMLVHVSQSEIVYTKKGKSLTRAQMEAIFEEYEFDKLGKNYQDDDTENFGYDYLRDLKITSMEQEKIVKKQEELATLRKQLKILKATTIEEIWLCELDELEVEYDLWYKAQHDEFLDIADKLEKGIMVKRADPKGKGKKGKK